MVEQVLSGGIGLNPFLDMRGRPLLEPKRPCRRARKIVDIIGRAPLWFAAMKKNLILVRRRMGKAV